MNLHLFEVALLIHAKETWEKFEGGGGVGGGAPVSTGTV